MPFSTGQEFVKGQHLGLVEIAAQQLEAPVLFRDRPSGCTRQLIERTYEQIGPRTDEERASWAETAILA